MAGHSVSQASKLFGLRRVGALCVGVAWWGVGVCSPAQTRPPNGLSSEVTHALTHLGSADCARMSAHEPGSLLSPHTWKYSTTTSRRKSLSSCSCSSCVGGQGMGALQRVRARAWAHACACLPACMRDCVRGCVQVPAGMCARVRAGGRAGGHASGRDPSCFQLVVAPRSQVQAQPSRPRPRPPKTQRTHHPPPHHRPKRPPARTCSNWVSKWPAAWSARTAASTSAIYPVGVHSHQQGFGELHDLNVAMLGLLSTSALWTSRLPPQGTSRRQLQKVPAAAELAPQPALALQQLLRILGLCGLELQILRSARELKLWCAGNQRATTLGGEVKL